MVHTAIVRGKRSWGAHEAGRISFVYHGTQLELPISYDSREAPYVPGDRVLVSLADEDDRCACAWATPRSKTLVGIGIDLASSVDFGDRPGSDRFIRAMFTERERQIARELHPNNLPLAYAKLFGAKEAAFKATARPLRLWYATRSEPLVYEVRDFCMDELGLECGNTRRHAAEHALNRMQISRIEIAFDEVDDMALVLARAYAD